MALDEVSQALGALQSEVERMGEDRRILFDLVTAVDAKVGSLVKEFAVHTEKEMAFHEKYVKEVEPVIKKINNSQYWALGLVSGLSLGGGYIGSHLPAWIVKALQ